MSSYQTIFDIQGQTAVVTGGSGHLGRGMAQALVQAGCQVAILGFHANKAQAVAQDISASGGRAIGIGCDARNRSALESALEEIEQTFGPVDILVNAAGGNQPGATTSSEQNFFDLDTQAAQDVLGLNFTGTFLCCQVFGRGMAERRQGTIINIASMSGIKPLTRVPIYSAAKAAIANFTQWLAVHMAQEYGPLIRVKTITST